MVTSEYAFLSRKTLQESPHLMVRMPNEEYLARVRTVVEKAFQFFLRISSYGSPSIRVEKARLFAAAASWQLARTPTQEGFEDGFFNAVKEFSPSLLRDEMTFLMGVYSIQQGSLTFQKLKEFIQGMTAKPLKEALLCQWVRQKMDDQVYDEAILAVPELEGIALQSAVLADVLESVDQFLLRALKQIKGEVAEEDQRKGEEAILCSEEGNFAEAKRKIDEILNPSYRSISLFFLGQKAIQENNLEFAAILIEEVKKESVPKLSLACHYMERMATLESWQSERIKAAFDRVFHGVSYLLFARQLLWNRAPVQAILSSLDAHELAPGLEGDLSTRDFVRILKERSKSAHAIESVRKFPIATRQDLWRYIAFLCADEQPPQYENMYSAALQLEDTKLQCRLHKDLIEYLTKIGRIEDAIGYARRIPDLPFTQGFQKKIEEMFREKGFSEALFLKAMQKKVEESSHLSDDEEQIFVFQMYQYIWNEYDQRVFIPCYRQGGIARHLMKADMLLSTVYAVRGSPQPAIDRLNAAVRMWTLQDPSFIDIETHDKISLHLAKQLINVGKVWEGFSMLAQLGFCNEEVRTWVRKSLSKLDVLGQLPEAIDLASKLLRLEVQSPQGTHHLTELTGLWLETLKYIVENRKFADLFRQMDFLPIHMSRRSMDALLLFADALAPDSIGDLVEQGFKFLPIDSVEAWNTFALHTFSDPEHRNRANRAFIRTGLERKAEFITDFIIENPALDPEGEMLSYIVTSWGENPQKEEKLKEAIEAIPKKEVRDRVILDLYTQWCLARRWQSVADHVFSIDLSEDPELVLLAKTQKLFALGQKKEAIASAVQAESERHLALPMLAYACIVSHDMESLSAFMSQCPSQSKLGQDSLAMMEVLASPMSERFSVIQMLPLEERLHTLVQMDPTEQTVSFLCVAWIEALAERETLLREIVQKPEFSRWRHPLLVYLGKMGDVSAFKSLLDMEELSSKEAISCLQIDNVEIQKQILERWVPSSLEECGREISNVLDKLLQAKESAFVLGYIRRLPRDAEWNPCLEKVMTQLAHQGEMKAAWEVSILIIKKPGQRHPLAAFAKKHEAHSSEIGVYLVQNGLLEDAIAIGKEDYLRKLTLRLEEENLYEPILQMACMLIRTPYRAFAEEIGRKIPHVPTAEILLARAYMEEGLFLDAARVAGVGVLAEYLSQQAEENKLKTLASSLIAEGRFSDALTVVNSLFDPDQICRDLIHRSLQGKEYLLALLAICQMKSSIDRLSQLQRLCQKWQEYGRMVDVFLHHGLATEAFEAALKLKTAEKDEKLVQIGKCLMREPELDRPFLLKIENELSSASLWQDLLSEFFFVEEHPDSEQAVHDAYFLATTMQPGIQRDLAYRKIAQRWIHLNFLSLAIQAAEKIVSWEEYFLFWEAFASRKQNTERVYWGLMDRMLSANRLIQCVRWSREIADPEIKEKIQSALQEELTLRGERVYSSSTS